MSHLQPDALMPEVVDLATLSPNIPPHLENEIVRTNYVNTLVRLLDDGAYAAIVEGQEGIGKTTVLAQFVRQMRTQAISVFISAANRLSFDPDLIRNNVTVQVYWAITREVLPLAPYDPALLKTYYSDLQRQARQRKTVFYFVVDGLEELTGSEFDSVLSSLRDLLPFGVPQFRFLLSGDEKLYASLFNQNLSVKSLPLTEFIVEETRNFFGPGNVSIETASDLNSMCRGLPGRLAGILRASKKGVDPADFLRDAPTKWPEFFEIDWKQVNPDAESLRRVLSLLAHDSKHHTIADVAITLKMDEVEVRAALDSINFITVDPASKVIRFASTGLRSFVAGKLSDTKQDIQRLLIKRLLSSPTSDESVLELPKYLEDAAEYTDLVRFITPDHILQVLERTQTLSKVDDTVRRGFRTAKRLGRDADILRFGIQKSIVADLAAASPWESEVEALVALRRDKEAHGLANNAVLREDRLQMLAALAHGIWVRGDAVPTELVDQIRLLVGNLDFATLGRRSREIASKLTCVSPDLAAALLKKSRLGQDQIDLDRAFAHLTVSALRDIDDHRRRDQALDSAVAAQKNSTSKDMLQGVRVLSCRLSPSEVCERIGVIDDPEARVSVLRYWCLLNGALRDADVVAVRAIDIAVSQPSIRIDAGLLADISTALAGAPDAGRKDKLIGLLDGIRATAERLGPSVDFTRLQLSLALSEASIELSRAEGRLTELLDYISNIPDLPSRGEAYAHYLGSLKTLTANTDFTTGEALESQCAEALEAVVLTLAESTADHYAALGGVISGLALGDIEKALDYTNIVNTERRRDAVLVDVVKALLRRPAALVAPENLAKIAERIVCSEERDTALLLTIERFADAATINEVQLKELLPIISRLDEMSDSVMACRALVGAIIILSRAPGERRNTLCETLGKSLRARWEAIDVGWLRVDVGFNIACELASVNAEQAAEVLSETENMKAGWQIAAARPASAYVLSIRLAIRALCGLLPRKLESEADLGALAALIDVIPSYGERAVLWADLCMRAALAGRLDLTERVTKEFLLPSATHISERDAAYRARVLIQVAPALYRAQPTVCLHLIESLSHIDRDLALREIIRFLISGRVPFDPVDSTADSAVTIGYDVLLQVHSLASRLETDWMIYVTADEVADCIHLPKNRYATTIPQREDISRRFASLAREKLPAARHITHTGYLIVTLAKSLSMKQTQPTEWTELLKQTSELSNIADRVYVMELVAMSLPKNMSAQRGKLLDSARQQISSIPWELDQIERYLGIAEELYGIDTQMCRDLVNRAAAVLANSSDDVRDQRRRLVDLAFRVDEEFAAKLIDDFDDDEAKHRAQSQIRLLEVRKAVADTNIGQEQSKLLERVRSAEVSRLGWMLIRALNAGRVQSYHPSEIRQFVELAADQTLNRAFHILTWYIENSVVRFGQTDQAATFLRPMVDACVVGAQFAGQIAGRSLVRLRALKRESKELSSSRSILVTPNSQEEAVRIIGSWLDKYLQEQVTIHDPYFGPSELCWVQLIRSIRPTCVIRILTSKKHQPSLGESDSLEDVYSTAWRQRYDQAPPKAEIFVIGGEKSKQSPIHDRWLVTAAAGLRIGTSLNSLGSSKDSEISEMSPDDSEQKLAGIEQYLRREKTEHNGEKLRLSSFWL